MKPIIATSNHDISVTSLCQMTTETYSTLFDYLYKEQTDKGLTAKEATTTAVAFIYELYKSRNSPPIDVREVVR